jgi:hypothetical protein
MNVALHMALDPRRHVSAELTHQLSNNNGKPSSLRSIRSGTGLRPEYGARPQSTTISGKRCEVMAAARHLPSTPEAEQCLQPKLRILTCPVADRLRILAAIAKDTDCGKPLSQLRIGCESRRFWIPLQNVVCSPSTSFLLDETPLLKNR